MTIITDRIDAKAKHGQLLACLANLGAISGRAKKPSFNVAKLRAEVRSSGRESHGWHGWRTKRKLNGVKGGLLRSIVWICIGMNTLHYTRKREEINVNKC
ncbi:unnamed protein product [Fusarium graminearum]|uniref:Chromosome 3, complete genome n=2 Tax=Gibberella zeae TaxID=5518 RepID=I1S7H4_GIBZE|nr:hypothetical protein FGSG_12797 [Fusarium graminearum PH-1]CAF3462233.1 unnamed protein product [Fusarium graminearum]ESU11734.1 hypothetical protein FGSG_12797 [Fusarium graminearum PH-1]CAF3535462.1 unnamed protein product [Fusarium graminearum]CAG1960102.1 unnamed protein product [Fusarium graminearum]CAG1983197.1 unnamed protein product [Fusarium graminearum]|eukprot:XP_011324310.1 hypothetical protein FGSG_12797 [Fusarium graminearum PH-1]